uniref:ATP synthase complex subunit 8 n=1 Tax=Curculionoidea sp. 18 KM-2017 TaxID=2219401 RepID=A0A346RGN5_9CUCU|nr:ATP synthase F0 subunit 8 [Curculionoidea sp. 18 KM-2017]
MPQMAPLNWMSLYLFFILLYIMMMIMNYYIFLYFPSPMKIIKMNKNYSWKW